MSKVPNSIGSLSLYRYGKRKRLIEGHTPHSKSRVSMATSSSSRVSGMILEDVFDLCRKDKGEIGKWLRRHEVIGNFQDMDCPSCHSGRLRLVKDASYSKDGYCFKCCDRSCNKKVSIRKGSWFEGSHMTLEQVLKLSYMWVWKCDQQFIMRECRIGSTATIVDWCHFCREVCLTILEEESQPIGGEGKVVEIDESKFGKRKYNKGRRVEGVWVFGGIERESKKCFMVPVEDRSSATLLPIIHQYVLPGTKIMSDCWKSYSTLSEEGYIHGTVNHSIEFVNSETGDHTQTIESTWRAVKRSLPRGGTVKGMYESYFAEYMFRRQYLDDSEDRFISFLKQAAKVYKPHFD